jgi:hypothetical protein
VNSIVAWAKSKNWTTHTVIAAAIGLAGLIAADPAIQDWIKTTLAAHPQIASLIVLASIAVAKNSHSSSPAGTLATARDINAAPNTPTSAEVDAAQGK